jgi:small subunit ribosomal protein S18
MAKQQSKPRRMQRNTAPKDCYFHTENKEPNFNDVATLRKFLTERGKIVPRSRSGLCAKHQNKLTITIKHARHLALLSFIVRS